MPFLATVALIDIHEEIQGIDNMGARLHGQKTEAIPVLAGGEGQSVAPSLAMASPVAPPWPGAPLDHAGRTGGNVPGLVVCVNGHHGLARPQHEEPL